MKKTSGGLIRKYAAFAAIAFREALAERTTVLGRAGFLGVILLIFSRLWDVVPAERTGLEIARAELIWYLALTEWIVLSLPPIFLDIEADQRSGDVAYRMCRPISYVGARVAEGAGATCLRLLTLAPAAAGFAWWFGGAFPNDSRGLFLAAPVGLLASALGVLALVCVGLSAFWIHDTSPVYWIWQKLVFVLGGLFVPLDVYPAWLQEVAAFTPFAPMLYGTGRMAFGFEPALALSVAARLVLWSAMTFGLLWLMWAQARRRLEISGG